MKIIFDGNIFGDSNFRTGVFNVAWHIFKELTSTNDCDVVIYADVMNMEGARKVLQNEFEGYKCKFIFEEFLIMKILSKFCGIFYGRNGFWTKVFKRIMPFAGQLYFFFSPKARRILKEYDIFFSPLNMDFVIKREKRIKKFIFLHDTIACKFPEYFPQMRWGCHWLPNFVRSMNGEDYYFANSLCTKNDFLELTKKVMGDQITVAPLACDEKFRYCAGDSRQYLDKYHIPADKKYVLSLCSIEPRKNLIRSVETFLEFVKKNSITDMVYVLAGAEWASFAEQFNKAKALNNMWEKYVVQIGYAEDADLPYLYSNAFWFVYTSQYEGFGLPPLEAMSCGCPVIVSNNSSLPEVVGEAGILIHWNSDEEHIKAYEKYYYEEKFRNEMRQRGLEQAGRFSWKNTGSIIVERMKEVMRESIDGTDS